MIFLSTDTYLVVIAGFAVGGLADNFGADGWHFLFLAILLELLLGLHLCLVHLLLHLLRLGDQVQLHRGLGLCLRELLLQVVKEGLALHYLIALLVTVVFAFFSIDCRGAKRVFIGGPEGGAHDYAKRSVLFNVRLLNAVVSGDGVLAREDQGLVSRGEVLDQLPGEVEVAEVSDA